MKQRVHLIKPAQAAPSIRRQAKLLQLSRSSFYYRPKGEGPENQALMAQMDRLFLADPTLGVLGMQDALRDQGVFYNVKRIRRLLRLMGIEAIYPKKNLSRLGKANYIRPYLLRGLTITRANQVWAIDITYIPMAHGFMYLTAIIDIYSRYLVGWQLSNSLEKENQTRLLHQAIAKYGHPEIINSDQGSQYTSTHWLDSLKELDIQVSMDGRGRATDNAFIERWFRTLKQKHVYLYPAKDGLTLYEGITQFVDRYNRTRHQGINRTKPIDRYHFAA
jgi:putative transposase